MYMCVYIYIYYIYARRSASGHRAQQDARAAADYVRMYV